MCYVLCVVCCVLCVGVGVDGVACCVVSTFCCAALCCFVSLCRVAVTRGQPLVHGNGRKAEHPPHVRTGPLRIAVVGAGSCGAGVVQALRQHVSAHHMRVDVFEQSGRAGGRAATLDVDGQPVEAGASIFVKQNRYMGAMADDVGVDKLFLEPKNTGVWDGSSFLFRESGFKVVDAAKAFWRYGMALKHIKDWSASFVRQFDAVYDMQDAERAFGSPTDFWSALDLYNFTQHSFEDVLGSELFHQPVTQEIVAGVLKNIYNQPLTVNGLAAALALAPLSVGTSAGWHAEGGNWRMMQAYVEKHADTVHWNTRVDAVLDAASPDGAVSKRRTLRVTDTATGEARDTAPYDVVVLALPLEQATVSLDGVDGVAVPPPRTFKRVHVTVVKGVLNPEYFGLPAHDQSVSTVLCSDADGAALAGGHALAHLQRCVPLATKNTRDHAGRVWTVWLPCRHPVQLHGVAGRPRGRLVHAGGKIPFVRPPDRLLPGRRVFRPRQRPGAGLGRVPGLHAAAGCVSVVV